MHTCRYAWENSDELRLSLFSRSSLIVSPGLPDNVLVMGEEPSENNTSRPNRDQVVAAVILAIVIPAIAFYGYKAWDASRFRGEVTAERLSEEFVTDPCGARPKYDGKRWAIVGEVIQVDLQGSERPSYDQPWQYTRVVLRGGKGESDGLPCGGSEIPLFAPGSHNFSVLLRWEDPSIPGLHERISATCEVKLHGFSPFSGAGISGYRCHRT